MAIIEAISASIQAHINPENIRTTHLNDLLNKHMEFIFPQIVEEREITMARVAELLKKEVGKPIIIKPMIKPTGIIRKK